MSSYFDRVERAMCEVVERCAHRPWYARLRDVVRAHTLVAVVAALVVATPTVAAVGAVSGWFGPGKPDVLYPVSASSGLGRVIPGTRMLPIQVADPDGGPPWGLRLVKTTRGDTCVQVGRIEYGELGSLGIDYSWDNDHKFHPISPNDGVADICGATDGAGHGFVSSTEHGWPASAYTPSDYGSGAAVSYCQAANPVSEMKARLNHLPEGSQTRALFEKILKREEAAFARSNIHECPTGSLRMIFVGLLGPDAKSIAYTTPSGATRTEDTVGGVGAYLIVFKLTAANCDDYSKTLIGGSNGCQESYGGTDSPALRGPNAVTSVAYDSGKTCSDEPSPGLAAAYEKFAAQSRTDRNETTKRARARFAKFLAVHHLTTRSWLQAVMPQCAPVGWVAAKENHVTAGEVASPLKVTISEGRRFCSKGPWPALSVQDNTIACDRRIPQGYRSYWETSLGPTGPLFALIRVSFTARKPVTTSNSFYEWNIQNPGNNGGGGNRTQADVRLGETVTFTMSEPIPGTGPDTGDALDGVYHGTISFEPNVGQAGPETAGDDPGHDGSVLVGTFSFRLPPKK
jgi:hypothetical protein